MEAIWDDVWLISKETWSTTDGLTMTAVAKLSSPVQECAVRPYPKPTPSNNSIPLDETFREKCNNDPYPGYCKVQPQEEPALPHNTSSALVEKKVASMAGSMAKEQAKGKALRRLGNGKSIIQ
ncbi:hypothetical protein DAPPUDRAFT_232236 [Daphnia pulex]|uniref:Uncharacterized protein n=1 Tax=Daphnia pulex TaxID=6669 RepID=E9FS64_DAPPU|nr:hypothetical protein DAPPUDRAFT_232236 [Daphnia pulex]|eukprot:EFX89977.1 hypothetical protein DAPPUDRAFT_232236 [Daphnia pulex]